jgi:tousled-like kinase
VDTWSCGVILYQMLFGRRPFGHDLSQEQILHSGTIRNAQSVEFPAKPSISAECRGFIQRCLAYRQADRPDVSTAAADPWMTYVKPVPTPNQASAAAAERE